MLGLGRFILFIYFFNKEASKTIHFSFKLTSSTQSELGENKPANLKCIRNEKRILKSLFDDNTVARYSQWVLLASKLHCKSGNLINYDLYLENVLSPQVSRSLY